MLLQDQLDNANQFEFLPNQIHGQPSVAISASLEQGFDPTRHLYYTADDLNASGEPEHPEEEMKRIAKQLTKEAKQNKVKYLARQQHLTAQFSQHEHLRVEQSKYYINNRTPALLDKQLSKIHQPLNKELVLQKKNKSKEQ